MPWKNSKKRHDTGQWDISFNPCPTSLKRKPYVWHFGPLSHLVFSPYLKEKNLSRVERFGHCGNLSNDINKVIGEINVAGLFLASGLHLYSTEGTLELGLEPHATRRLSHQLRSKVDWRCHRALGAKRTIVCLWLVWWLHNKVCYLYMITGKESERGELKPCIENVYCAGSREKWNSADSLSNGGSWNTFSAWGKKSESTALYQLSGMEYKARREAPQ